ncbi:unnamed protein product [Urochloa decumbens]|uniref:FLZ-type domain-containing protein n=1 Tax=Urochloa decumbens TaxID=240449 RepID=A0ABC9DE36_9POAL
MSTNTRKRPRNSGSSSRSSGGGSAPSPSPSSQSAMIRRTTSLSNLGQTPEPAGRAPTRMAGGEAAAAAAVTGSVWGAEMRRYSTGCFPVPEAEAAFLKACGLCKRGLGPGRDTFIYMGEVAFCSQECRQHQMNLDELKEKKCSGGGSDQSGKSSTIAAA